MSDLLSIGSSGVYSYQRALATVSNNIANVGTEGYNRQDVTIASNQPRQMGPHYIGTGSRFDGVKRLYDAFLESNVRNSQSDLSSQAPMSNYVNRLINVMADQNIGLSSAFNRFFESARDLATDPASIIARNIFLRDSDGLASRFRELSSQIRLLDDETRQAAINQVGKVNALTSQIAQVNGQLTRHATESKQPPELLDQRDLLLIELAKATSIKTSFAANGQVMVSVGDTLTEGILVDGQKATRIGISDNAIGDKKINLVIDPFGSPKALPNILSGELGGLLRFREQVLEPAKESLDDLARMFAKEVNLVHSAGIDLDGKPGDDLFGFNAGQPEGASSIRLLIDNPMRVAAGSLFRVINDPNNLGNAHALVNYQAPEYDKNAPTKLLEPLASATLPQWLRTSVNLDQSGVAPMGLIPQGMSNLTLELESFAGNPTFQIFTRDGKHLIGQEFDKEDTLESKLFVDSINGMEPNARYVSSGLSPNSSNHLGMDLFFGAKASVGQEARFSSAGVVLDPELIPAQLKTSPPSTGSVLLNGFQVPALEEDNSTLNEQARWLNQYSEFTRVEVSIEKEALVFKYAIGGDVLDPVMVPASLGGSAPAATIGPIAKDALVLNGFSLPAFGDADTTIGDVKDWLNSFTAFTGVVASIDDDRLVLSRPEGNTSDDIRLGIGSAGVPADLARLGFAPRLYFSGEAADDLLIFATGPANGQVNIVGQYQAINADPVETLRGQNIEVKFTAADRFELRSINPVTGDVTLLGERGFNPNNLTEPIQYRGLEIRLSSAPKVGDTFLIDANRDGIGNNEAMLRLVELEFKGFGPGNQSFNEIYIERVNQVGNVARQTSISQQALEVVFNQAREARDAVSGVSLDEEAAALVRFQQAYQANARVMQMASTLFEAILQVR